MMGRPIGLLGVIVALTLSMASPAHAATIEELGYLEVRDGTRLRYHVVYPAEPVGARFPVLLHHNGYEAGTRAASNGVEIYADEPMRRGYALLGVSVCGTGYPARSTPLRPYHTHARADAQPLTPDEPTLMRVEVFPFAHALRAGSRLRVWIDAPTGRTGLWGFAYHPEPAVSTVCTGPQYPSKLVAGVIPGEVAGAPLPACDTLINQPCRVDALTNGNGLPEAMGGTTPTADYPPRPFSAVEG